MTDQYVNLIGCVFLLLVCAFIFCSVLRRRFRSPPLRQSQQALYGRYLSAGICPHCTSEDQVCSIVWEQFSRFTHYRCQRCGSEFKTGPVPGSVHRLKLGNRCKMNRH